MNVRVEICGHVFYLDWSKAEAATPSPPDNAPQPMVVYPSEPEDTVGFTVKAQR